MKKIAIEGMSCMHCVGRVDKALNGIEGVSRVEVKLEENCALVEIDETITNEQLIAVIDDAGYDVLGIDEV